MEKDYSQLQSLLRTYMSNEDIEYVNIAYVFAKMAHEGQVRKSGEPYIMHPIAVAEILAEQKLPKKVIISALLHDVVEDTNVTSEEITKAFGQEVSDIVYGVTKLGNIKGMSTDQVKAANHRKIIIATAKDLRVILVKLADRIHNMRTIKHMNPAKQKLIASETLDVYAPIAHRLGMYKLKWELEDLSFKVINKEAYNDIAKNLKLKRSEREQYVVLTINRAIELMEEKDINAKIMGRSKHIYSIYRKMKKKNVSFNELNDLFAFRIIVDTIAECYTVLGIIHEAFKPIPLRFKDYIPTPKHNLYQSIHTTVLDEAGTPIEFQIRTREMDVQAEFGVASHFMYKNDDQSVGVQREVNFQVSWLEQALKADSKDDSLEFMEHIKNDILSQSIIVYTPKGDVVELPLGSTVLDFAYYIHTNVGNHAVSAVVNYKVVSLFYKVEIGDVITVVTSEVAEPSINYLSRVKTSRARDALRKYFKDEEKQAMRNEAKKTLIHATLEANITDFKGKFQNGNLQAMVNYFNCVDNNDFLFEVAVGEISIEDVIIFLKSDLKMSKRKRVAYSVSTTDTDYEIKLCRYCSPILGDSIVSSKKEFDSERIPTYYIHRTECPNAKNHLYKAHWGDDKTAKFSCRIGLDILDVENSIYKVVNVITENNLNIKSIYFQAGIDNLASGRITLDIKNILEYNVLLKKLNECDNVVKVIRLLERK